MCSIIFKTKMPSNSLPLHVADSTATVLYMLYWSEGVYTNKFVSIRPCACLWIQSYVCKCHCVCVCVCPCAQTCVYVCVCVCVCAFLIISWFVHRWVGFILCKLCVHGLPDKSHTNAQDIIIIIVFKEYIADTVFSKDMHQVLAVCVIRLNCLQTFILTHHNYVLWSLVH